MLRKLILFLILVVFMSQIVFSQGVVLSPKKSLTKGDKMPLRLKAAWTGKEWGVFYSIYKGGVEYLRVKKQGKVLSRTPVFSGNQEAGKSTYEVENAYWSGSTWGITYTETKWADAQNKDSLVGDNDSYFLCLDKEAKPLGDPLYLTGGFAGKAVCLGNFFQVFYAGPKGGQISAIKVSLNGNLIGESKSILDLGSVIGSLKYAYVKDAIVTKDGVVLVYFVKNDESEEKYSAILTVDFNSNVIKNPKILQTSGYPFEANHIRWTGKDYALSGWILYPGSYGYNQFVAAMGLADANGKWKMIPKTNEFIGDYRGNMGDYGIAYNGYWIYHFYRFGKNYYAWARSDDGKAERDRLSYFSTSGSGGGCSTALVSDMTGLFLINAYSVNNRAAYKGFYRRFTMEHTEKPMPVFLEGKIHNVDGKKYAVLAWHIKGCDKVIIRGTGQRFTLSSYGWLARQVNNSVIPFTVIGRNKSGKFKTVYKVK